MQPLVVREAECRQQFELRAVLPGSYGLEGVGLLQGIWLPHEYQFTASIRGKRKLHHRETTQHVLDYMFLPSWLSSSRRALQTSLANRTLASEFYPEEDWWTYVLPDRPGRALSAYAGISVRTQGFARQFLQHLVDAYTSAGLESIAIAPKR